MADKYGSMPNNSKKGSTKHSDTDSGAMGSNKGASTGLKKATDMRADVTKQPSNKNLYPNGLA